MTRFGRIIGLAAFAVMAGYAPAALAQAGAPLLELVGQSQYDKARKALSETPHSPIDELFLEAQILAHQGRLAEAVAIYRAMLAANPALVPVRQILAQTLLNMGDWDAARFHFRTLMEAEPNANLRVQYANALRLIEQKTPSGINASFAVIPSTNVNRGTSNTTISTGLGSFVIDPNSREESGVGFQIGVNAFLRQPYGKDGVFTFSAGATQTIYGNDEFNVTQPTLSAAFTKTGAKSSWTATAFASRAYRGTDNDSQTFGLQFAGRRQLEGTNVLTYSVVAQDTEYDQQPVQSGPTYSLDIGVQRQIDPTMAITGGLKLTRGLPEGDHLKYIATGLYGGVSKNWRGGWSGFAGLEVGMRSYDENFTALSFPREDDYVTLRGSLLNSTLSYAGFAPRVNCSYQINSSNVAFYDYDAVECSFEFTRGF